MLRHKMIALMAALGVLFGLAPIASAKPRRGKELSEIILDGHKVINVVDDFLVFWERAKGKTLRLQRRLWARMVEGKHRDYFERAVYRNADCSARRKMLDEFLEQVPARVEAIREFNRTATDRVTEGVLNFKARFPEYRQQRDIYVGISLFRFDGAVRPLQNDTGVPDTVCLGADALAAYSPEQVRVAIVHELFHAYHFNYLFRDASPAQVRAAHMRLMAEGMAIAGAEAVYPYQPHTLYLRFSEGQLDAQQRELVFSSKDFLRLIREGAPPEQYERWFANDPDDETPLRGGYLLGYEVTNRVLAVYTLPQMVRMTPAQLREHAEEQLVSIATDQVLLLVRQRDGAAGEEFDCLDIAAAHTGRGKTASKRDRRVTSEFICAAHTAQFQ
ncbi:MAG TPA: hypothetical protein VNO70_03150 [Blastocatellia bacterium]|nr:hypothetical protein [Blastocatellia bacterium]